MAKMTLDQKIQKVRNSIQKENALIEASRNKVKDLSSELKSLLVEKDNEYANNFLKLMSENGFTSDDDKKQFMELIKEQFRNEKQ